jgi:hypothetical protein
MDGVLYVVFGQLVGLSFPRSGLARFHARGWRVSTLGAGAFSCTGLARFYVRGSVCGVPEAVDGSGRSTRSGLGVWCPRGRRRLRPVDTLGSRCVVSPRPSTAPAGRHARVSVCGVPEAVNGSGWSTRSGLGVWCPRGRQRLRLVDTLGSRCVVSPRPSTAPAGRQYAPRKGG